jgi:hypothetical protein
MLPCPLALDNQSITPTQTQGPGNDVFMYRRRDGQDASIDGGEGSGVSPRGAGGGRAGGGDVPRALRVLSAAQATRTTEAGEVGGPGMGVSHCRSRRCLL